jgi:hypothetical protein
MAAVMMPNEVLGHGCGDDAQGLQRAKLKVLVRSHCFTNVKVQGRSVVR